MKKLCFCFVFSVFIINIMNILRTQKQYIIDQNLNNYTNLHTTRQIRCYL